MYDCTQDVMEHKRIVFALMRDIVAQIESRADVHDDSKLLSPEKELFDKWTPELRRLTFGTDDYKQALDAMGEGVQHHYKANRHHPEHFENGVSGMTLVDLVEMFCDWVAAAKRNDVMLDLESAHKRFNLDQQLVDILSNTFREMR